MITNATYGYAGWIGARWYVKPVAEAAAAWGRYTIQETIEMARELGLNPLKFRKLANEKQEPWK